MKADSHPWPTPDRHTVIIAVRLLVCVLTIIAATAITFDPAPRTGPSGTLLFDRDELSDIVRNLILFIPFGAVLYEHGRRRSRGLLATAAVTVAASFVLSASVEYVQRYLPGRYPSAVDVLSNVAGALIGLAACRMFGRTIEAAVGRLRRLSVSTCVGLVAAFTGLALSIAAASQMQTRLSNWSAEYPLLIGNERTGDRPWRGRVFALDVADAAVSSTSVARFARDGTVSIAGTHVATFDFDGHAPYEDASGHVGKLDWVNIHGRRWLQSSGAASALAQRIVATNAFTLRVVCATEDAGQKGPARIVSNSWNTVLRNFTLGQQGADLVVRLRTPKTGLNGIQPEFVVPGVFSNTRPQDILVTFDGATLQAAAAHSAQIVRFDLTPPHALAVAVFTRPERADELEMLKIIYIVVLSVVPGGIAGLLSHNFRFPLAFSISWACVSSFLIAITQVITSGRSFEPADAVLTAAIAVVVAVTSMAATLPVEKTAELG